MKSVAFVLALLLTSAARAQMCNPPPTPVAPGPPGTPICTAGNASVSCSWTAAAASGVEFVQGYALIATPGGAGVSTSGLSATVNGLTNGTGYTFTVAALTQDCQPVSSTASNVVTPQAPVGQPHGTWANVTPLGFVVAGRYGAQYLAAVPGTSTMFVNSDLKGLYKSVDSGLTWAGPLATTFTAGPGASGLFYSGSPTFQNNSVYDIRIAADGARMYATIGGNAGIQVSTSKDSNGVLDGLQWTRYSMQTNFSGDNNYAQDPYFLAISPVNPLHVLASNHQEGAPIWVKQSFDGGATWSWVTHGVAWSQASYLDFAPGSDSTFYVLSGQSEPQDGLWRTTDGGATFTEPALIDHPHGGGGTATTADGFFVVAVNGVYKSTDGGTSFTHVATGTADKYSSITATAKAVYASAGFPSGGSWGPGLMHAPITAGVTGAFVNDATPSGMLQGANRCLAFNDGVNTGIICSCWNGGIWRFAE